MATFDSNVGLNHAVLVNLKTDVKIYLHNRSSIAVRIPSAFRDANLRITPKKLCKSSLYETIFFNVP